MKDSVAAFAVDQLPPLELLRDLRTDAVAADGASVVPHGGEAELLSLAVDLVELVLEAWRDRGLDGLGLRAQLVRLLAQIAERVLPFGVRGVVAALQLG